uniref:Leucine rich repeat and sterile alpha motif containing 1 n=1 Tax=Oreochromis niloticus TaxID=8128 RepID=A0A669ENU7_ORENI
MPLFFRKRKPNEDCQKRLEYQLCRSKEAGADDILDISACGLSEVRCRKAALILTAIVLILHNNELRHLMPKGIDISTLITLKVLDLHENKLTSLPEDIGKLTALQILNVEKNHLKALPESIGNLRLLQTLNLKGNCLTELPSSVGSLSSLRTLDVSDNNIVTLPKALAYIRTLESFSLDAAMMSFPPSSVCTEGTESIQRFLCTELGEEYCPPSQYLLPVLESDSGKQSADCLDGLDEAWQVQLSLVECEQKQQEKLAFEKHLEEKQREHTQLVMMKNSNKENILNSVRQEQERVEQGVSKQQRAQEAERQLVLEKVRQAEDNISSRISSLLMDNNRSEGGVSVDTLNMAIRMEHLTAITQEEANSLRKKEVAAAMQKMLSDSCAMSLLQEASDYRRQSLVTEACRSLENLDRKFDKMLSLQVLDKSKAIAQILQEEEMQKAAFQALQLQKDAVHGYIRNQVGDDASLFFLFVLFCFVLFLQLVSQRTALSDMLQQLLKQRDQREQELRQVLAEMELKSESNQQNYWMIQYQRLLDAKPLSLRMQEAGVEKELVNLLCKLSAQHYLPILAHHRVTTEALRHMSSSDLKKVRLQCKVLRSHPLCAVSSPPPFFPSTSNIQMPSPPLTPGTPGTPVTPSAPTPVEGPGSSECVVCMETESQVIFLPCGHVCCCQVCNDALQNCPLCRANISQRIRLYQN